LFADALIDIEIEEAVGVPETIARRAADRMKVIKRKATSSFEEGDQVWAVFDRDDHPHFERAINICEGSGVLVARSNPCFELWLVLHFKHYDKPGDAASLQKHLETLCGDYKRSRGKRVNCVPIMQKIHEAERRAESQLKSREQDGKPYGAPSTTVGRLTAEIRKASEQSRRK
jgi:hypothetical protein